MGGDYSKDGFDALRDFAGVFLQQGRPVLDSDWNEMVRIFERRIRTETVDIIGRAVVPRETDSGFHIRHGADGLEIGPGRIYVDGLLAECHGGAFADPDDTDAPVFDRGSGDDITDPLGVLDEMTSAPEGYLAYADQPYWPVVEDQPTSGGPFLAYLVVWNRELTPVKDPSLLDPALGGVDSATRWQTVWQVRLLGGIGDQVSCATPEEDLSLWPETIAPSTARLTTRTVDVDEPEDPCLVPPTDGYTGLENQFYRVEIHMVEQGGDQTGAWFKYSRENASVAARIESFATPADTITVRTLGRDEILRFRPGDWVEITDDRREFDHRSGQILQVTVVHEDTREIELSGTVEADLIPTGTDGDTATARNSRLVRWDQRGVIKNAADDSTWWDLDAENPGSPDGLIPVPPEGTVLLLESGITVAFSTAAGPGRYREMDAWSFHARTAGTQIEELTAAPPHSVQRHYCKLAVLTFPDGQQEDCRIKWPPEIVAGEGCACSVCITPDSHNSGTLTIQMGIDRVAEAGGGTVCLDPGDYDLDAPLRMENLFGVTLKGHGITTVLTFARGTGAAIEIDTCIDLRIEDIRLNVDPESAATGGGGAPAHGIRALHTATLALRRLAILVRASGDERLDHGIVLEGMVIGAKIEECLIAAPMAIGSLSPLGEDDLTAAAADPDPGWLALCEVRLLDNILFGGRFGMRIIGIAFSLAGTTLARNLVFGQEAGLALDWFELPTGGTAIDGNTVLSNAFAIAAGINDMRIQDNEISGGPVNGDGILLIPNVAPQVPISAQLIGNRISDLAGAGIRIGGTYDALLIKRNVIRRCGAAGIQALPEGTGRHIAIEDNVITGITGAPDGSGAAGIALTSVVEGQARGNTISGVGLTAAQGTQNAGIAMQGIGAMAIEGNAIYEIGPDDPQSPAWGILVRPPWVQLSITRNRIDGTVTPSEKPSAWKAIEVAQKVNFGAIAAGEERMRAFAGAAADIPLSSPAEKGFAAVDDTIYELSRNDTLAIGRVRPTQVAVAGNQVANLTPTVEPPVMVLGPTGTAVDFSQNQCDFLARFDLPALALVSGDSITASANTIRHRREEGPSILFATDAAAPVGNITSGGIEVTPGGLQPPFDAINLRFV